MMITKKSNLFSEIENVITNFNFDEITAKRKEILLPLINFIKIKATNHEQIRLNFICTHNSRRSHLAQIWAQTAAAYYTINNVFCYSGGTEVTAMFPIIAKTLENQGFKINVISEGSNPIYSVQYNANEHPIIAFSKNYDNAFNPANAFGAILTCTQADAGCPFVAGAEQRFPITYKDPKEFDNTPEQTEQYYKRSFQIATEMFYVFSQIKQ